MAILAVIGVGSGDGAAAAAAPVTGTVASSSVVAGSSVKATLTAVPATSGTAKLQYKSGSTWKTDARSIVVTNGKGSTTLKPPSDRSYRFVYGGVTSAAFTVKVTAGSVKGTVASSSVVAGSSVKATLTAVPATSGTAKLQYKSGSTWKTDARSIVVTKGSGSTTLKPPSDRSYRFVYGGVTSAAFTVKVTPAPVTPAPVTPASVTGTVASASVVAGSSVKATLTAVPATSGTATLQYLSGGTWKTDARSIVVTNGNGSTTLKPPSDRSYRFVFAGVTSAAFTVKVTASPTVGSFIVTGSGWGHGVGMSQYGAYGMALDGYDATGILTHYFTGTSVSSVDTSGGKDFRVQIFGSGSDSATSVDLVVRSPGASGSTAGEWRMRFYASDHSTLLQEWTGAKDEDLVIGRNGTNITATRANGTSFQAPWVSIHWEGTSYYQPTSTENAYVELLNKKGGTAQTHGQYRHGRMFLAVISSRINIVNSLNLNTEYLYGVAEMPSSWSSAALQAQAIAARGYAMRALASGKSAACGCNVYDDARSQNFSGWKKESEGTNAVYGARWVAAVDATNSADGLQGQVLKDPKDTIATTYYFSSSGGQTENSEQVWSSTISYLRAASDPWSLDSRVKNPNASWTATVTQDKARAAFGLTDVATIAVTKRTSSASTAAAYVLTATSSTGQTSSITGADNIRIKLGLKSPWIWSVAAG